MLQKHRFAKLALLTVPAVVILSMSLSCGGGGLKTVDFSALPVQTATPEELVAKINGHGQAITSFKAKLALGLKRDFAGETKRCSGMLLADRSNGEGLYLKGYKRMMPTLFTLVSDGREFWFHIPRDDVVYTGPVDFTWGVGDSVDFYLNAGDLIRALFLQPLEADARVEVQDDNAVYVVSIFTRAALTRKLWVERKRFTVVRELYYDKDGREQLDIQRNGYVDLSGRLYPSSIVVGDPVSGSSVFLDFDSITPDPENVPENAFRFEIPVGVEVERVGISRV